MTNPGELFYNPGMLSIRPKLETQTQDHPSPRVLSKTAKKFRRAPSVQRSGYLDLCNTRFSEAAKRMQNCQKVWVKESKEDQVRWRMIGCGERRLCPVDAGYLQGVLAREASEGMLAAQTYFDIVGNELKSRGLKIILTIPKSKSKVIDDLLWTDEIAWTIETNKLIKLGYKFVKRWFLGAGGNMGIHFAGESNPGEPNYHLNFYVFPAAVEGIGFRVLDRWYNIKSMRDSWTCMLNNHYGLDLADADFRINYLDTPGQLRHWQSYQYRPVLADLWAGWHGFDGDVVHYSFGHGKRKLLSRLDAEKAIERAGRIPVHFKRMRWWGIFSDGQRSKTMNDLELEPETVDDNEPEWRVEYYARLVRYEDSGVTLRVCLTDEVIYVPESEIVYRPKGVSIGKRKRWVEPGGNRAPPLIGG